MPIYAWNETKTFVSSSLQLSHIPTATKNFKCICQNFSQWCQWGYWPRLCPTLYASPQASQMIKINIKQSLLPSETWKITKKTLNVKQFPGKNSSIFWRIRIEEPWWSLFGPECDLKKVFFLTHPPLLHPEKTQYLPKDNNGWVGHYKYFLPIQLKEARILEFLLPESEEEGPIKPIKHQI